MVIFQQIDHEGTRATDLAQRVGVTKQTIVHLVDELERRGYLERVPDANDGRAKMVRMTSRGWEVHELATELVEELDRRWAMRMGRVRYSQLRDLLIELDECVGERTPGGGDLAIPAAITQRTDGPTRARAARKPAARRPTNASADLG
jgi:DNA-binding MarR family transcriptional regulator